MRRNPERLAWIILLTAFFTFCLVATACPLSVRWYLLNARVEQKALLVSRLGTIRVEQGRQKPLAISADDPLPTRIYKGNLINIDELGEGLLTLQQVDREEPHVFGTVLIYPASTLQLVDVYSPRFGLATDVHTSVLRLREGDIRVEVNGVIEGRSTRVKVLLLHGEAELTAGSYTLRVYDGQAAISVHRGKAILRGAGAGEQILAEEQRSVLSSSTWLVGDRLNERDLLAGSDLGADWAVVPDSPEVQPPGSVAPLRIDGKSSVHFSRNGEGPSEVGILLPINRGVDDLSSLVLHLKLKIKYQSLSVCGSLGSECPVMVRIDYEDASGGSHQWVHGFYAYDNPDIPNDVLHCYTCPLFTGNHGQVPPDTWISYDSPNLMQIQPEGAQPVFITSVKIYASGHSYDSIVTGVALLAQD